MKKQLKALLIAGMLAGLAALPVYGGASPSFGAVKNAFQPTDDQIAAGPGAVQEAAEDAAQAQADQEAADAAKAKEDAQSAFRLVTRSTIEGAVSTASGKAGQKAEEAAAFAAAVQANLQMGAVRTLDPSKPMIALTYDDGPQSSVGNRIMDVMNRYGGKCTFFLVGERVPAHAAEVQRMANEGFEIANHTQNHKYLNRVSAAEIHAQVDACNNTIEAICGVRPTLMRLPGGNKNSTVLANVTMPIILWNVDTLDWKTRNAQSTINSVLGKVKDGDIVLMHELYGPTADATDVLVPALVSQGFQLVTVSELAYYRGLPLQPGQIYSRMP